jgi:hypothetical protein
VVIERFPFVDGLLFEHFIGTQEDYIKLSCLQVLLGKEWARRSLF